MIRRRKFWIKNYFKNPNMVNRFNNFIIQIEKISQEISFLSENFIFTLLEIDFQISTRTIQSKLIKIVLKQLWIIFIYDLMILMKIRSSANKVYLILKNMKKYRWYKLRIEGYHGENPVEHPMLQFPNQISPRSPQQIIVYPSRVYSQKRCAF